MWDAESVERYEAWYASPRGSYALACERALLSNLLSVWPRRNNTLLEIGCGAGHFLDHFWEAGFDISGLDSSNDMLNAARARLGHKVELHLGQGDHTPFDDGHFDFSALVTVLEYAEDPDAVLQEALRVASKGVLVLFLNPWSCYWMEQIGFPRLTRKLPWGRDTNTLGTLQQGHWFCVLRLRKMLHRLGVAAPVTYRSTLFAPSVFWGGGPQKPLICQWGSLFPFGAVVAARIDLSPVATRPMTLRRRATAIVPQ